MAETEGCLEHVSHRYHKSFDEMMNRMALDEPAHSLSTLICSRCVLLFPLNLFDFSHFLTFLRFALQIDRRQRIWRAQAWLLWGLLQ